MTPESPPRAAASSDIPSGTVTFCFTDIEGSTIRWERDRAAMEDAVRRHDSILREAIGAHRGHVFKTIGDAFCASFARPEDAVAAMLDVQRALARTDFRAVDGIRVRAAVHTGTSDERDGDYFGPTVNRVARLLSIGHGGQVLLSGVTADLVRADLAPPATLRDLGEHRLKDLSRPERVSLVLAPDLPATFPALRSLDVRADNLPVPATPFVGRETDVAEIAAMLETHRLVTIVGSGGIGKTRTSLQVAANVSDRRVDGVWLVELASLSSGEYLPSTIAIALGLTRSSSSDAMDDLIRHLRGKRTLLIFDNCEHLIESSSRAISALLRGCAELKILASSRQGLGIAGEATYRLPSLPVPPAAEAASLDATRAMAYSSIALLCARARAGDARFALTGANVPIVADICRRLDGIPLAIELAAARLRMLSPAELRERLDERFRLLTGGSRDALPRQQTLRALIDWSYDLLEPRERALFRRLGVFAGGFTIEGAIAVGCGDDLDEDDVFDLLTSLVDRSLVLADPGEATVRYRMLESTCAYARERLATAGERETSADRHLTYVHDTFRGLRERYETTANRSELVAALTIELDNVRAALDVGVGARPSLGAALVVAPDDKAWGTLGLDREIVSRIEAYLDVLDANEHLLRARLWGSVAAFAASAMQMTRSMEAASNALTCARACGDRRALFDIYREYVFAASRARRFEDAESVLVEAEAIANISARQRIALLEGRCALLSLRGDAASALPVRERLVAEARRLGDETATRTALMNFAEALHESGDTPRAVELLREVLAELRVSKDRNVFGNALANVGGYLCAIDSFADVVRNARETIAEFASDEPASLWVAIVLEQWALVFASDDDSPRAARLEGFCDAALRRAGFEREFTEATTCERLMTRLHETLAPADLERLLSEGAALSPDAAIRLAVDDPSA
jgi:predicted ATPase/class 3 adenylate cyclase